jgi:hypothetical protein
MHALAALVPFVFSLLALVFSLLATTSPEWASRNQYPDNTDAISQTTPLYTLYRSPFQICTETIAVDNSNSPGNTNTTTVNGNDDSGDDQPPASLNYTYTSSCTHFAVYGWNKTSCELPSVAASNLAPQAGDARQCQQIHLAGNFQVASAVFLGTTIGLGFADGASPSGHRHHHHEAEHRRVPALSVAHMVVQQLFFPFAVVGAGAALISQFYAILGLVQSAPNNADFASSQGNREHHDPWVQGKALSIYMSLSWFWALLAAWAGWLAWGSAGRNTGERFGHAADGHGYGDPKGERGVRED